MALEDELAEAIVKDSSNSGKWVRNWVAGLDAKDRKTWDAWVADPEIPGAVLHRVLRKHGFPFAQSSFRRWLGEQRRGAL